MYNVFQPNHFYPNRTRSQDRIGGGVFNSAGRAMFGHDNMSQPDIHQNGRSSANRYPGIEDLRRPSVERRTREPSRANSISSLVKMEDRVSKKYDPIFGMNGHPLLDEYAGVNKLEDQLGQVARGPVSGAGYGNNDEYHQVDVPSRNPSRNPSRQIGYPNDRYIYDTPNHFVPNQMPGTIAPYRGPMKKLHIPTSLPSIQKSQVVHSDNREFSPNYPNTYRQSNTYDDPNFHVYDFPRSKHHESVTYRELEDRLKQYNKDNKLRIKLLKQNQKIDMLMQNQMRSNSQVDIMSHAGNGGNVGYPYANRPYMMEPPNRMYADLVAQQQMWSKDLKKLKKIIKKSNEKERDDELKKSTGFSLSALLKNKLLKKKSTDPDQSLESVEVKKKDTSSKKPSTDKGKTKDKPKVSKDRKKTTTDKSKDPIAAKVVLNTDGELVIDTAGPETEPEDPDEQEAQQLAQKKARSNLRKVLWTMIYPCLLENHVIGKILKRKDKQLKHLVDMQNNAIKNLASWMYELVETNLNPLFNDKNLTYDFIGLDPSKKLTEQTKKTRAKFVQFKLITMFEDLLAKTKTQPMQAVDMEYLASISLKEIYAQSNMFTNFEIMRLAFNAYGRLDNLTQEQSQMILAVNLLIRVLIYKIMLGVKSWYQNVLTNQALLNFQILGSVLYRIVHNIWTNSNPVINRDPSKIPLAAVRPLVVDINIPNESTKSDEQEIIVGAFSKQQVGLILYNNDEWLNAMNKLILQWIEEIFKKVVAYRKVNPQPKQA